MRYTVDPGLYALGNPGPDSPVLVSANYKLSFDRLREALPGQNAWVLVLDTKGVNVWCAAGKGTFGTDELVDRISSSHLSRVVNHNLLVVPQLGASGVSAHEVKKLSGFKVIYGPVRASDLPEFLDRGLKADPQMRIKTFTAGERLVLVPVEFFQAMKLFLFALPFIFLLCGFGRGPGFWVRAAVLTPINAAGVLIGIIAGCLITPLLLPWLPGRAFAVKGILPGIAGAFFFIFLRSSVEWALTPGFLDPAAWLLIDSGNFFLPGDEFHRVFHLHIPFRRKKGNEVGGAAPGCRPGNGHNPVVRVRIFLIGRYCVEQDDLPQRYCNAPTGRLEVLRVRHVRGRLRPRCISNGRRKGIHYRQGFVHRMRRMRAQLRSPCHFRPCGRGMRDGGPEQHAGKNRRRLLLFHRAVPA